VLCVQEDIADKVLDMLRAAPWPSWHRRPGRLDTDIGPVIDAEAQRHAGGPRRAHAGEAPSVIQCRWRARMRQRHLRAADRHRDRRLARLQREVFGPVLHVVRYRRPSSTA
jgi:RHH-type proline utilization regulon transcriptional repressor/proline dehydrogenase/delta 1-pyrroline-5-carboxylate dehydrogenase